MVAPGPGFLQSRPPAGPGRRWPNRASPRTRTPARPCSSLTGSRISPGSSTGTPLSSRMRIISHPPRTPAAPATLSGDACLPVQSDRQDPSDETIEIRLSPVDGPGCSGSGKGPSAGASRGHALRPPPPGRGGALPHHPTKNPGSAPFSQIRPIPATGIAPAPRTRRSPPDPPNSRGNHRFHGDMSRSHTRTMNHPAAPAIGRRRASVWTPDSAGSGSDSGYISVAEPHPPSQHPGAILPPFFPGDRSISRLTRHFPSVPKIF